jgi:hypothetical protein
MSYIGNSPTQVAFVTDQFSGNGSQVAFTMSVAPANPASTLVAVSGVLQDPSTYGVSGTTLTFTGAPPSGTGNISVRYLGIPASNITTAAYRTVTDFTATSGQTTFTPPSYTAGYINVFRNGVRLGAADYTATNGTTVVLATGAYVGDLVTTESYYVSSVIGAIPATAGAVNGTYLQTGVTITNPVISGTLNASTGVLSVQNGMTGIAKAWVSFYGISTVTVNNSFNVSSVTRNATGIFTINFTTAMANANYVYAGSGESASGNSTTQLYASGGASTVPSLKTTTQCQVNFTVSSVLQDPYSASSIFLGN